VPSIRETFPVVRDSARAVGATVVVSQLVSFGGAWAASAAGVRSVTVTTGPSVWLSRHHPTVFANWRAPAFPAKPADARDARRHSASFGPKLRRLAAVIDAPVIDTIRTAELNLGVWPEWFRAPAPDDPPRSRMCGFVFNNTAKSPPLPPDVEAFLAVREAPIVAAFGSAASIRAADRYRAVADACAKLSCRCLLVGPSATDVASAPNLRSVVSAPYAKVFPAAAAIVHHGGFGTCAEALRAGKPSLVTPFTFDQFDTAARVHDAGLGHWFAGKANDSDAIAAALDSILHSALMIASTRAAAAARISTAPDGADRAASLIIAL
jgi:rhamnosyltransferase subunit B